MTDFAEDLFDFCEDTPAPAKVKSKKHNVGKGGSAPNVSLKDVLKEISSKSDDNLVPAPNKKSKFEEDIRIDTNLFRSRISVHQIDAPTGCSHDAVLPPDTPFQELVPITEPAREFPFKLDSFQQRAVLCIDNLQSVLVSAHTSAGKTVVAEYAIALALKKKQRVLYTTPIKALSNQKYREFSDDFADVGLMTGDVTINPNASCIIMTTEILRSMLYRGSEVLKEVGWVIFDEIHYMRNKERGYVWEETIILLQDEVRMVFLSATVPNALQFAEWVVTLHQQPVHVVYTEYRPVPLQHYIFPAGGNGIFLVVDEKGEFREGNFNRAMATLQVNSDDELTAAAASNKKRTRQKGVDLTSLKRLVSMVMEHDLAPVIVFSFAKRECENYATECANLDINSPKEKELVKEVFENATDVLNEDDKNLPQVKNILPLLMKGIGIHHGGLLPILKETIEILFGEGLIKVLFATETFAMGLNMPARTVMFTSARKFDGKEERWLHGAEYIQMSGRAGRRGKDDKGVVIFMVDEKMSPAVGRNLLKGNPEQLTSAFQLTYNMVLNLLRVDGINPEFMLQRSFHQFQSYTIVPPLLHELEECQKEFESIKIANEEEFATYHKIKKVLEDLHMEHRGFITLPKYIVPFLNIGRLVEVKQGDFNFGWAMVVRFKKAESSTKTVGKKGAAETLSVDEPEYDLHVLLRRAKGINPAQPARPGEPVANDVVAINMVHINRISSVRMKFPDDLTLADNRALVMKKIDDIVRRFGGSLPMIDPVKDMKITDENFKVLQRKIGMFEDRMRKHSLTGTPDLEKKYQLFVKKVEARDRTLKAKEQLKAAQELLQMEELKKKTQVLKHLNYCSATGVLEIKGRIACELSSADELLLTEMLFDGMFTKLTIPETMALLSCLVCDEKSKGEESKLAECLSGPLRQMQEIARKLGKTFKNYDLPVDPEEYVSQFKPYLMDVVYEWAKGSNFSKVLAMTDIFEGSIIRCMRRLEEVTRQLIQAAKGIGNKELEEKFSDGIKAIKRDIVFAASLYL